MKDTFITVSSLDKVFPNLKPCFLENMGSCFINEPYNFIVSCFSNDILVECSLEIDSEISNFINVYEIVPIGANLSQKQGINDNYILKKHDSSTLYPDLLLPIKNGKMCLRQKMWTSFWVSVNDKGHELPYGEYPITIKLFSVKNDIKTLIHMCTYYLTILNDKLPQSDLIYTNWVHYDCITDKFPAFSDEYYDVLNKYLSLAIDNGMNMLYTPLFTPPLDTKIGGERQTIQLIDVDIVDNRYKFDFSKLKKFMDNALLMGIKYFELSHIATQWGAKHCPKIMANVGGEYKRIFGWDSQSTGEEYLSFLDALFTSLYEFFKNNNYLDKVFFHISDEPQADVIDNFIALKKVIKKHFPDAKVMDALVNYEFYKDGTIDMPFVATSHVEEFIKNNALNYVYYCGCQRKNYLSNRFLNMPSQRNRILGIQLYANKCKGFLHWGYNFYNSGKSLYKINPYFDTDAGGYFESGDSFIVYPLENGATPSLRLKVTGEAFNDYRALKLYEKKVGREKVDILLQNNEISGFSKYPRSGKWHKRFRETLNNLIINS